VAGVRSVHRRQAHRKRKRPRRFGVTQSAISRRIRRYLEATGQLEQLGRSGRRRRQLVNVVSLSNFTDTELPQRSRR
jgi:hypothetical protein